jgi:hypothetical protein
MTSSVSDVTYAIIYTHPRLFSRYFLSRILLNTVFALLQSRDIQQAMPQAKMLAHPFLHNFRITIGSLEQGSNLRIVLCILLEIPV